MDINELTCEMVSFDPLITQKCNGTQIGSLINQDMSHLRNVWANIGPRHIPNGEFQLEKNHRIMLPILTKIKENYKGGGRTEIGPLFGNVNSIT